MTASILIGDCRTVMASHGPFDMVLADPPYGDTSLAWDKAVDGWLEVARASLKPTGSLWLFGSLRSLMILGMPKGWRLAQDIVWEKANGTGFAADRFKRVHEHAAQLYRSDAQWGGVYNDVQRVAYTGPDKHVRARNVPRGEHLGEIGHSSYEDDGTRIQRSVIRHASVRGGEHKTEKPVALLEILIRTSCPPGGLLGDFFAGSGAGGEAAMISGRNYVGAENDPAMAAKARDRLAGVLPLVRAA